MMLMPRRLLAWTLIGIWFIPWVVQSIWSNATDRLGCPYEANHTALAGCLHKAFANFIYFLPISSNRRSCCAKLVIFGPCLLRNTATCIYKGLPDDSSVLKRSQETDYCPQENWKMTVAEVLCTTQDNNRMTYIKVHNFMNRSDSL